MHSSNSTENFANHGTERNLQKIFFFSWLNMSSNKSNSIVIKTKPQLYNSNCERHRGRLGRHNYVQFSSKSTFCMNKKCEMHLCLKTPKLI
uniref:Uncharacterized protein n=1 Tax=Rhizophora mucronata TaxID=61149 RepID=A0A2P2MZQ3_RHIMU